MSTTPIDVPSYLSDEDYGVATVADCGSCQATIESCGSSQYGSCDACQGTGGSCESAQGCSQSSGCGTCQSGQSCNQSGDCGSCQAGGESCGTSQSGICSACEGVGCMVYNQSGEECKDSCQGCQACMVLCESCEGCEGCQSSCQYSCQGCQSTCENSAQRPSDASWTTIIAANSQIQLTAEEWNAFTASINLFRTYKGLGEATFTTVAAGDHIKQEHFTQARSAINDMSPPSPVPDATGIITAASLNGLMVSLNSIT